MTYEFDIMYYFNVIKKEWKKVAVVVIVSVLMAVILSLRRPPMYISTVTLISSGGTQVSSLAKLFGVAGSVSEGVAEGPFVIPILQSKRMARDIAREFNLDRKTNFTYNLNYRTATGVFAIDVKGTDPDLIEKIANFVVVDIDKINEEMDLTPKKPMLKVMDPAERGTLLPKGIFRKAVTAGLLTFLLVNIFIFLSNYIKIQIALSHEHRQ